jgi:hypothetical protein
MGQQRALKNYMKKKHKRNLELLKEAVQELKDQLDAIVRTAESDEEFCACRMGSEGLSSILHFRDLGE